MRRKTAALLSLSLFAVGLLAARALASPQQIVGVKITCSADGKLETIQIEDGAVEKVDEQRYEEVFRRTLPDTDVAITLTNSLETPYRCIGAFIYNLQRLGYRRIGFISEPPPAER